MLPIQNQYGNPIQGHAVSGVHTVGILPTTGAETVALIVGAVMFVAAGWALWRASDTAGMM